MADETKAFEVSGADTVKALPGGVVGGYLVRFSGPSDPDLSGDFFDAKTDVGVESGSSVPVYYHHGFDETMKTRKIGKGTVRIDDVGVWLEAQLNLRDEYEQAIYDLAKQGKLGWSSGAAGHLVEREPVGKAMHIKTWPIAEASLTPTPAEPRNGAEAKAVETPDTEEDPSPEINPHPTLSHEGEEDKEDSLQEKAEEPKADGEAGEVIASAVQDAVPDTEPHKGAQKPRINATEQEQILEDAHGGAQMDESLKCEIAEVVKGVLAEVLPAKEEPAGATMKAAPAIKKVTELGFSDEPVKALMQYLRKGDRDAAKAALQEDTGAEGGYMVPDDFYARVVEKRNPASWIRQAPVTIIPTSLQKVIVPAEDTAATKFVVTAEEGSVDENEPTFAGTALEVHKLTKLVKASEELLADAKVNLDAYFASMFGRALALAENYYFTIGTGTGMPQGIVAGATASGITTASATAITATEMASLFGTLGAGYNVPGEVRLWMKNASLWYLRGLTGNPFQFWQNPGGDAFGILGAQVHVADDMDAITNSGKAVLVGNATYYAVAERQQLTVRRLTELYAANGQVGILATVRMGGVVTQSEAFKYLTQHS